MKLFFTLLFVLITFSVFGQQPSKAELEVMEDEALLEYYNEVELDSIVGEKVARVYLDRARKEKDTIKMARGYDRLARLFHPEKNIMFADSVIELTRNYSNITYPGLGYMIKGYEYYKFGNLELATENYLKLYNISIQNENIVHQLHSLHSLISLKLAWGDKNDALRLQHKRNDLLNKKDILELIVNSTREGVRQNAKEYLRVQELTSMLSYVVCYIKLEEIDSARIYLNKGLEISRKHDWIDNKSNYNWFREASVEVDYHSGNYLNAIRTANEILNNEGMSFNTSTFDLYFFKGLSLIEIGEYELGISSLKKSDSIYLAEYKTIAPYQRVLFEKLLDYSRYKGDEVKQIEYLGRLLYVDSIFKINYKYFEPNFIQNLQTPWLLKEKEDLIASLERKNELSKYGLWGGLSFLFLSLITLGHYMKLQALYKKRFQLLVAQIEDNKSVGERKNSNDKLEIGVEVINEILKNLDRFEKEKKYLTKNLSLQNLASKFGTNTKYLSNVINLYREQSFPQYLNNLRVEFALKEITDNPKFRKYTIKAIASDCGFNSAESFSKAFYKKHKVFPSYYIKKLEELKKN